jgi:hypothetical protein
MPGREADSPEHPSSHSRRRTRRLRNGEDGAEYLDMIEVASCRRNDGTLEFEATSAGRIILRSALPRLEPRALTLFVL